MNTLERVEAALTPGSIFNQKEHIWRTVDAVRQYAGLETEEEILGILNGGDLGRPVTYRPSAKGKGLLVAFQDLLPIAIEADEAPKVKIMAGTIVQDQLVLNEDLGLGEEEEFDVGEDEVVQAEEDDDTGVGDTQFDEIPF